MWYASVIHGGSKYEHGMALSQKKNEDQGRLKS
jgi:hypothetical protein